MKRLIAFVGAVGLALSVTVGGAFGGGNGGGPGNSPGKTYVCHFPAHDGDFVISSKYGYKSCLYYGGNVISIGNAAVPAHVGEQT